MRQTINTLHDRVNRLISTLLYASSIRRALDDKQINARQYTIASQLLEKDRPLPLEAIRKAPCMQASISSSATRHASVI